MNQYPKEPTAEECSARANLGEFRGFRVYACWYPQMGGYVGRCVVLIDPTGENDCFEAYIWHDGDFPFDDGRRPAIIHHCDPNQFVEFGQFVAGLFK